MGRHFTTTVALLTPNFALAYGASGGAILEFYSLCLMLPLGLILFFLAKRLKSRTPVIFYIAFAIIVFLSTSGTFGLVWSFQTEVGGRPVAIAMHAALIVFIIFINRHLYRVASDS